MWQLRLCALRKGKVWTGSLYSLVCIITGGNSIEEQTMTGFMKAGKISNSHYHRTILAVVLAAVDDGKENGPFGCLFA